MHKLLIIASLFASPVYAQEDPIITKARADLEASKAKTDQSIAEAMALNEAILNKYKQEGITPQGYHTVPSMSYIRFRADLYRANMPRRHRY